MSENLKDILSHLHAGTDDETLLLYLQGKLSAEQQHKVEEGALHDAFEQEALEGLSTIGDSEKLALMVAQLKADLKKRTGKKRAFRRRLQLRPDPSVIIAVVVILLLVVVAYFVLHRLQGR